MNLLNTFTKHWQKEFNQWPLNNCHLILAVSGGVDSVVMTDLFYQAGFDFTIVHCNFQLRGSVSDSDALFVKALGEKYEKEVIVKEFDTANYAAENKIAIHSTFTGDLTNAEQVNQLHQKYFQTLGLKLN